MKILFKTAITKLLVFSKGLFCGAMVSVAPVALIHHKDLNPYFSSLNWSVIIFFSLSMLIGGIICLSLPSLSAIRLISVTGYLFFYTACAALCQRIHLTPLTCDPYQDPNNISISNCPLGMFPGTILICLAALRFVTTAIERYRNATTNNKSFSYSCDISWLLFMAGIPLIFGVWLPLLAIPGAWIITRWLD